MAEASRNRWTSLLHLRCNYAVASLLQSKTQKYFLKFRESLVSHPKIRLTLNKASVCFSFKQFYRFFFLSAGYFWCFSCLFLCCYVSCCSLFRGRWRWWSQTAAVQSAKSSFQVCTTVLLKSLIYLWYWNIRVTERLCLSLVNLRISVI